MLLFFTAMLLLSRSITGSNMLLDEDVAGSFVVNNIENPSGVFSSPCDDEHAGSRLPFCDSRLAIDERVRDLVGRIPNDEKAGILGNSGEPITSVNISAYQWWGEALHGLGLSPSVHFTGDTPYATQFPQVILTACSFNTTLFRELGKAISTEARAMFNQGNAGLTFWAPNINVFRDPRWGRGQETPGEDPKLNGDYAEHYIRGMQEDDVETKFLKVSACCKHFAAYSLENWNGYSRFHFDARVSEEDLRETYLPAFQACVERGKVSALMCSYNAVNGVPACLQKQLMTNLARDEWGFDGYITSDCGALTQAEVSYHYKNEDHSALSRDMLDAGVDIGCDKFLQLHVGEAMENQVLPQSAVDKAVSHLLRVQMRLGMFEPPSKRPFKHLNNQSINSPSHQRLALEAARQGIVLLKNEGDALPLNAKDMKKVAVIGPHGETTIDLLGNYCGRAEKIVKAVDAIKDRLEKSVEFNFVKGCSVGANFVSSKALKQAAIAAWTSDVVIALVGLNLTLEGEGHDRTTLLLPKGQRTLLETVLGHIKGKLIMVVISGGGLDLSEYKTNAKVSSILWAGYPGQVGAVAIAETLFGANNPSGRLTQTFYPEEYTQVNMSDMRMHADPLDGFPGRGYRFYKGQTVYQFGTGMSYTTFRHVVEIDDHFSLNATVTNTGRRKGAEVLLAFAYPGNCVDVDKVLVDYVRTEIIEPGQTVAVVKMIDISVLHNYGQRCNDVSWLLRTYGANDVLAHESSFTFHPYQ